MTEWCLIKHSAKPKKKKKKDLEKQKPLDLIYKQSYPILKLNEPKESMKMYNIDYFSQPPTIIRAEDSEA